MAFFILLIRVDFKKKEGRFFQTLKIENKIINVIKKNEKSI